MARNFLLQRVICAGPAVLVLVVMCGAQPIQKSDDQTASVRRVAEMYISGEADKLRTAFYPDAKLFAVRENGDLWIIPFSQYLENVIKNSESMTQRPQRTIDQIERAGNIAIAKITTLSPGMKVIDFLTLLEISGQWKIVSKAFHVERVGATSGGGTAKVAQSTSVGESNSCSDQEHQAFNFMLGRWKTSESTGNAGVTSNGASEIEGILNGCGVFERRHAFQGGKPLFDAQLTWAYDEPTKRWLLYYADDHSRAQLYEGRRERGGWAFYRERLGDDGKPILVRIKYTPTKSGFTQTVERSRDGGNTWQPASVVAYEPAQ